MIFTAAQLSGILLGWVLLVATGRKKDAQAMPAVKPAWLSLAMGSAAAAVFAVAMIGPVRNPFLMFTAIGLPTAAVVLGGGRLARGDRRWQIWLGFIFGLLPALFWVAFAIGEVVMPGH
jgi:hypothetical protein